MKKVEQCSGEMKKVEKNLDDIYEEMRRTQMTFMKR